MPYIEASMVGAARIMLGKSMGVVKLPRGAARRGIYYRRGFYIPRRTRFPYQCEGGLASDHPVPPLPFLLTGRIEAGFCAFRTAPYAAGWNLSRM